VSYCDNFALIDFSKEIVVERRPPMPQPKRSDLPAPRIASDIMPPVQSQVDGQIYESKSGIRRSYKVHGVEEIGNDPARLKPFVRPKNDRRKIKETVEKAVARVERGERYLFPGK
jgi:hypothetical protein